MHNTKKLPSFAQGAPNGRLGLGTLFGRGYEIAWKDEPDLRENELAALARVQAVFDRLVEGTALTLRDLFLYFRLLDVGDVSRREPSSNFDCSLEDVLRDKERVGDHSMLCPDQE